MPPKAVRRSLGGMKRFMLVLHVAEAFNGIATGILRYRGAEYVYRESGFSVALIENMPSRNRKSVWHHVRLAPAENTCQKEKKSEIHSFCPNS